MKPTNPFIIKGYIDPIYFCDRENKLKKLSQNVNNGIDTTLISPRRMGKTGLILRFFDEPDIKKYFETLYVDIYPTRSISDFIQFLASAILKKFPEKTSIGDKFLNFIKGFRPLIGFDSISGEPQVQFTYNTPKEKEYNLESLLNFLDSLGSKIIIAIDEFQQITEYPEQNIEALLRTYTQNLKNMRFIYCGSKRSMMIDIFSNAKRPFYSSTQFLTLYKIDNKKYLNFIKYHFHQGKKVISDDVIQFILNWSCQHTFYTQQLCNQVFQSTDSKITVETVKAVCADILKNNEPIYLQYRKLLTHAQWNYLIAIAREGEISKPTAQQFLMKYNIGTPANSRRLLNSLIEKELILETTAKKGMTYHVYDVFFSRWLESEYFNI